MTLLWKGALAVALLVALVIADRAWDLGAFLDPDNVAEFLKRAGPFAPFAFMGAMALAVVVSPLPSLPLDIAAGVHFGSVVGTLYAALGALVGSMISFGIARLLGRHFVEKIVGGHISFCQECSDHLLTRIVLLSRLIPVLSFDLISYGAGLTKMSLRNFALATFIGQLPLTFVYVSSGAFLASGRLVVVIGGALAVVLFLALPRWIEKYDLFGMRRLFQHE